MRAFLGLGSNLGDRRGFLTDAIKNLPDVVAISPLYETEPVGVTDAQDSYLNCVVELAWDGSVEELLVLCRELEHAAGRVRHQRWEARTLDVDVLLCGELSISTDELTIPHPRMYERRFVMAPLADIAPELVAPDWSTTATGEVRTVAPL